MAILSSRTKTKLKSVIEEIIEDSSINTEVTYKQYKLGTPDIENQTISSGFYTDFKPLDAIKTYFTDFERHTSNGEVEEGDVRFIIFRDHISSDPSTHDLIVETKNQSSVTYGIIKVGEDSLKISYVFHCRRP